MQDSGCNYIAVADSEAGNSHEVGYRYNHIHHNFDDGDDHDYVRDGGACDGDHDAPCLPVLTQEQLK